MSPGETIIYLMIFISGWLLGTLLTLKVIRMHLQASMRRYLRQLFFEAIQAEFASMKAKEAADEN